MKTLIDTSVKLLTPRDYQQEALERARKAFRQGFRRILIQQWTGTGKSVLCQNIGFDSLNKGRKILFLVPRDFLVDNLRDYFNRKDYGVVQTGVEINYSKPITIALVPTLYAQLKKGKIPANFKPDLIVWDECFVAGTLVDGKPIETLKIGDYVKSWNEDLNKVEYKKVTRLFKNPAKTLVKLTFDSGKTLVCTLNHPFYTDRGWINAGYLTLEDTLYGLSFSCNQLETNSALYCMPEKSVYRQKRKNIFFQKNGKNLLFGNVQTEETLFYLFCDNGEYEQKICFSKNEEEQSYDFRRDSQQSKRYFKEYESQTSISGGQWKAYATTSANASRIFECYGFTNGSGAYLFNEIEAPNVPLSLQIGSSQPSNEINNRGRWQFTWSNKNQEKRSKEAESFTTTRLVSIEVYEPTNTERFRSVCSDGYVYNVEVEDNHTYFVEGILTHNCHHIEASSWKELASHFGEVPTLGLTATPERFDGKPLSNSFDTLITTKPLRWFIDNEYLSDYRIHGASFLNVDFKKKAGEYDLAEQSRVYDNPTILGNVVDYWIENFLGIKSVYFCAGTQHSLDLAEQFNSFGRRYYGRDIAAHIDHKTPKKEKKRLLDRYRGKCSKDEELFLLTNVGLFLEGLNVPETKVTGWCRKTASLSVWMQGNGRSLRFEPGRIAHIVDHANNLDEPDPMPLPDTPIIWDLNGRQKNAKSYKLICFNCENLLCNDYRDYWQSETKALLCDCGCLNRIPEKQIREMDSSSERRGYDLDEEATITLLESKSIRFELNRILKKARELNAKGKKGNGFAVYRIQELFEKNGGFSFEDLKYALCDGLGYQPRFALERWKQWKSELIQDKEETKVG